MILTLNETKNIIKQNILKIISFIFLPIFFKYDLEIVLFFVGCWILKIELNSKMIVNMGIYWWMGADYFDILSVLVMFPCIIVTLIVSYIDLSKKNNKILIILLYIFFILYILLRCITPESYHDGIQEYSIAIVNYFTFFTMQEKNLKDCLSIKGIVSIVITLIIFYYINFVNILSFFKVNNEILEYTIIPNILRIIKILYYIFVFNLIKNLKK